MDTYIPSMAAKKSTAPWLAQSKPISSGPSNVAGFELPNLPGVVQNRMTNRQNMLGDQDTSMGGWLSNYNNAIRGQENIGAMYNRLGTELGLPQLRQNAFNLQSSLEGLPQTLTDASKNFNVNANQLARMTATKQAQLAPLAQKAIGQAQFAENTLNQMMPNYLAQQTKELAPFEKEYAYLTDRNARETTGFNIDAQNELDAYIQKMNAGVTLTEGERERANRLALAEKAYKQAIDVANINANTSKYAVDKQYDFSGGWG